tara:strand:+ start:456 stop:1289 length:834 start_codon:yes stop_codon:yes gene_type:complete
MSKQIKNKIDCNNLIVENFGKDVGEVLKAFLESPDYNETYDGAYTGIVVDNNDSDKIGRCRIRVFGVHGDNIQDKDLPWSLPDFKFIGGLKGSFIVPPIGCIVNVYFEKGERYLPRYTGKVMDTDTLPTNKDKSYPDNMVFYESDNGDSFEIDRKKKETTLKHSSGTQYFMDDNKTLLEHNSGTKIEIDKTKMVLEHDSGAIVTMNAGKIEIEDSAGNKITLSPAGIKLDAISILDLAHGLMIRTNATAALPTGTGIFCGLPFDIVTGVPQTSQMGF